MGNKNSPDQVDGLKFEIPPAGAPAPMVAGLDATLVFHVLGGAEASMKLV
jgi:hypothetical protein